MCLLALQKQSTKWSNKLVSKSWEIINSAVHDQLMTKYHLSLKKDQYTTHSCFLASADVLKIGHFAQFMHIKLFLKRRRKTTDFVEAGDNVAEVDPGRPSFCHLVKQVIPEKFQQVAVARLRPCRILLKPDSNNTSSQSGSRTTNHSHSHTHTRGSLYACHLLWPLVDGAQFGQQAEETTVLHLLQTNNDLYSQKSQMFFYILLFWHFGLYFTVSSEDLGRKQGDGSDMQHRSLAGIKPWALRLY